MSNAKIVFDVLAERELWKKLPEYNCFWTDPANAKGLQLDPIIVDGKVYADMCIARHHTGFPGIAHGGVGFAVLDGVMGWYVMSHLGRAGVTIKADVKYLKALKQNESYRFEARSLDDAKITLLDKIKFKAEEAFYKNALRLKGIKQPRLVTVVGEIFNCNDVKKRVHVRTVGLYFLPEYKLARKLLSLDFLGESEVAIRRLFPDSDSI